MAETSAPKMSGSAAKLAQINITDWKGGFNSFIDEGRLPMNALRMAVNMMLDQDGVPKPRWGTNNYGDALDGIINGDGKFVKVNASSRQIEEWNVAIAGGKLFVARNAENWEEKIGVEFQVGYDCSFLQIDDKVFVANEVDNLAYYDITDDEMHSFEALATPSAPTLARSADLADGNYTCFYKITAVNDVGETKASASANIKTNVMRESWQNTTGSSAKSQNITLSWQKVEGATRYNIYYGDSDGQECYIDSTANLNYNDDARTTPNIALAAPQDDTTGGPKMGVLSYSDNRMWGTRDPNNPYRVYWGGVAQNTTAFSPFFGGGWIDIAKGGSEIPVVVKSYRDGKGDSVNTVFMTTANGRGTQYQIALNTMTVGTTTFVVPMVSRVIGSLGTNAPNGVVEAKNNLFFPSTQSFNTTGAKPDMLNVLSTDEVSLAIRPDVRTLSNHNSEKIFAIFFDGKIFFAVPYGTTENSEIWVLDLEINCWMRPWKIAAKRFVSYTDTDGIEHLLYRPSVGDSSRLIEIADKFNTDNGIPFDWNLGTGLINFDKTHMSFERVKKIYMEFLRASGALDVAISGSKKNKSFANLKNYHIAKNNQNLAGWNNDVWGEFSWNESDAEITTSSYASLKKVIKVRKTLNNIKIELSGKSTTQFTLSVISIQGVPKRTGDPSSWKK